VPDRQQEELGLEPAARLDDDVVGTPGRDVDNKPIDIAELVVRHAVNVHPIEVDGGCVQVISVDISEPGQWMIHASSFMTQGQQESRLWRRCEQPRPARLKYDSGMRQFATAHAGIAPQLKERREIPDRYKWNLHHIFPDW